MTDQNKPPQSGVPQSMTDKPNPAANPLGVVPQDVVRLRGGRHARVIELRAYEVLVEYGIEGSRHQPGWLPGQRRRDRVVYDAIEAITVYAADLVTDDQLLELRAAAERFDPRWLPTCEGNRDRLPDTLPTPIRVPPPRRTVTAPKDIRARVRVIATPEGLAVQCPVKPNPECAATHCVFPVKLDQPADDVIRDLRRAIGATVLEVQRLELL